MKAIVCTAYGGPDVLKLEEVETPRPKAGEVLVRVHATTASRADCEIRRFEFPAWVWLPVRLAFGVVRPRVRILGQEFAGEVEALGDGVTAFAPGDRVYGTTGIGLAPTPSSSARRAAPAASWPDAGGPGLRRGRRRPLRRHGGAPLLAQGRVGAGQRVLIIGAGGSFGTFAVQLAKHAGAEVVAVDSGGKLEMLRELGADQVIDYAAGTSRPAPGLRHRLRRIGRAPYRRVAGVLRPGGRYVVANPHTAQFIRGLWASLTSDKKMVFSSGAVRDEHLRAVTGLIKGGALRPVIDRWYPLEQMAEAHRYAETEQKLGNIVIVVE